MERLRKLGGTLQNFSRLQKLPAKAPKGFSQTSPRPPQGSKAPQRPPMLARPSRIPKASRRLPPRLPKSIPSLEEPSRGPWDALGKPWEGALGKPEKTYMSLERSLRKRLTRRVASLRRTFGKPWKKLGSACGNLRGSLGAEPWKAQRKALGNPRLETCHASYALAIYIPCQLCSGYPMPAICSGYYLYLTSHASYALAYPMPAMLWLYTSHAIGKP